MTPARSPALLQGPSVDFFEEGHDGTDTGSQSREYRKPECKEYRRSIHGPNLPQEPKEINEQYFLKCTVITHIVPV